MKGRMTVGAGRYICFRVGKIEVVSGKLIFLVKQAVFIEAHNNFWKVFRPIVENRKELLLGKFIFITK